MDIGRKPLNDTDFLVLWTSIERELEKLAAGGLCSASQIYNSIYIICTSPTPKFETKLYWKIGDFIYMMSRGIRKEIFGAGDWVEAYNAGFRRFKEMVFAINELCDFLNECIRGRSVQDFGFLLWERCVLQQTVKYKHTTLGFELVNRSRMEVVREAIESFRLIVPDPKHPLLYYTQRYEQLALQRMKTKYEEEINGMSVGIETYSSYVREKMLYEKSIQDKIFLGESWPKVEAVLEEVFILNRRSYLFTEMYRTMCMHELPVSVLEGISQCCGDPSLGSGVEERGMRDRGSKEGTGVEGQFGVAHPINDFYELQRPHIPYTPVREKHMSDTLGSVSTLYQNLSWLKSGYEILKSVFVRYIGAECERHMDVYGRNTESLYIFYCMLRHVVDVGLMGDAECFKILKKEFSGVCMRLKPSLEERLIDFSESIVREDSSAFGFLDCRPMFGGGEERPPLGVNKGLESETQGEGEVVFEDKGATLQRVFGTLYKLIEKRQEFYEMYLVRLSRRLLSCSSQLDRERRLVEVMARKGNQDFVRKAETMISDIGISLHYNKDQSRFVWMLTQAYWPMQTEELSIQVPVALMSIRKAYDFKFSKKKLYWAWYLGEVTVCILGHEISMNIPQYSIVDLFNRHEEVTVDMALNEVKAGTRMTEDVLRSLVESRLVVESGGRYKISRDVGGVEKNIARFYRNENTKSVHEVDKSIYYQSLVSLILKRNKKMATGDVVEEARRRHTKYFEYDSSVFEESVRTLVDKGIVEEAEDFYIYLP